MIRRQDPKIECQVLNGYAQGMKLRQIAERIDRTPKTVVSIYNKWCLKGVISDNPKGGEVAKVNWAKFDKIQGEEP